MRRLPLLMLLLPLCAAAEMPGATVTRGPYLQIGTSDGITVRWRTNTATDSRVRVRTGAPILRSQRGDLVFDNTALTTEHEVTVAGLAPFTRYFYTVGSTLEVQAGGDSSYNFVPSPPAGPPHPTRLWVLGDSGRGNLGAMQVRDEYLAYPGAADTNVWLMLGDNAYSSGTDSQYQTALFDIYTSFLRSHVLCSTRGNHDGLYAGPNNDYYDILTLPAAAEAGGIPSGTEAYYSFDYANIHFLCLDSMDTDRSVGGAMHLWMELDLANTSADWVIAYWHHPPYSKGSHNSDSLIDSEGRLIDMRENFLPALESAGVDLVLSGHTHDYERSYLIDGHYGFSSEFGPAYVVDGGDGDPTGDGAYAKATLGPSPHEGAVYVVAGNAASTSSAPLNHPAMVTSLQILGSMVIDVDGSRLDAIHLDSSGNEVDRFAIVKGSSYVGTTPAQAPLRLRLDAAPNPSSGQVRLDFELPRRGTARLAVYDLAGRLVANLRSGDASEGQHAVGWDGGDARGQVAAPGVYFAVLTFDGESRVRRIVRTH